MERLFLRLVSLSLSAGWLVLAVLLLRPLLRRAPRRIVCLLWALVALRLVCPAQIEWRASLMPARETVTQTAQTTLARTESALPVPVQPAPESPAPRLTETLAYVWLGGTIDMLLWAAVSDVRLRLRLRGAVREEENIWRCEGVDSPFVLGVFRPRICLPPELSGERLGYVLAHERGHIARGDHVWKPLGWLLLCVYWFHPLLWLAYALLCRDLELACDERVARGLDRAGLADYAETLLSCGCRRRYAPMSPVAFGELSVKARVKAVLRYRRPVFLRVAAAVLTVAAVGAFFLTERPAKALALARQGVAAVYTATQAPVHPDDLPPAPTAQPEQPESDGSAGAQTWTYSSSDWGGASDSDGTSYDEEQLARYWEMNESYIRENQEIIAQSQTRSASQQTTTQPGPQSVYPYQTTPTQPTGLTPNNFGNGVTWVNGTPVISLDPQYP